MSHESPTKLTREQVAALEAGRTAVSSACAVFLIVMFLLLILTVPVVQLILELRESKSVPSLSLFRDLKATSREVILTEKSGFFAKLFQSNKAYMQIMHAWETKLEDISALGQTVRPVAQSFMTHQLKTGNEQVYHGLKQWLFYRPDVDCLIAPSFLDAETLKQRLTTEPLSQPDPRLALIDFQQQLNRRGIHLIVMPVPVKPVVHPENLFARAYAAPLRNPGYELFLADLAAAGIQVFDPTDLLIREFRAAGKDAFLTADSHWRPEAMRKVSEALAELIKADHLSVSVATHSNFEAKAAAITNLGDIAGMLSLPEDQKSRWLETVEIEPIWEHNNFWRPDKKAEILVLGDSFANIFSLAIMGWGESAGFVEHLSFALQTPLDALVINHNGAYATRAALARALARGEDRLAGKRLLIYQFAVRELAYGDWQLIELSLGSKEQTDFLELTQGTAVTVRGTVSDIASAPRPGSVPYADHIISLHLTDLDGIENVENKQALVYIQSMDNNVWTEAARLRPGETIQLQLEPWEDVARRLDGVNRAELEDLELQLQEPCWGTKLVRLGFTP